MEGAKEGDCAAVATLYDVVNYRQHISFSCEFLLGNGARFVHFVMCIYTREYETAALVVDASEA